jgi:hypothetical protein
MAFVEVYLIGHKTLAHSESHDFRNNAVVYGVIGVLGSVSFTLGSVLASLGGRGHARALAVSGAGLVYALGPFVLSMLTSHAQAPPGMEVVLAGYVCLVPLAAAWLLPRRSP